jgi:hypothetical protein
VVIPEGEKHGRKAGRRKAKSRTSEKQDSEKQSEKQEMTLMQEKICGQKICGQRFGQTGLELKICGQTGLELCSEDLWSDGTRTLLEVVNRPPLSEVLALRIAGTT